MISIKTPEELATAAKEELDALVSREEPLKANDRLKITPQEMPSQDPAARVRNFNEVALGYTATPTRAR